METILQKTERTYVKLIVGLIGGFVLLVLLCWTGFHFYHGWQEKHLLRRAAAYRGGGEIREAGLSARRAYQLNPESVPAVRMLAELAEAAGERAALDWRRKAVSLSPGSAADRIALAKCALQFEELHTAEEALAAVPESEKSASFHATAAELAKAKHSTAEARDHWSTAVRLDPANKNYQLQLAITDLPDSTTRQSARTTLEEMRKDPEQRAAATRALIVDGAANRTDTGELINFARELQNYPEATFTDRLIYLAILQQLHHPDFTAYLTEVEKKAPAEANDLAKLIAWMNSNRLSALALNYSRSLEPAQLSRWPVPAALAESYSILADWAGLESWTSGQSWEAFDFLRRAYLARALRGQEKTVAAKQEWDAATKEAWNQPWQLSLLARTVIGWRWTDEAVDLLWELTKVPSEQTEALQGLYQHYSEKGDTAGLYRTLLRLVEVIPDDLSLQNNLAQVGLLLNAEPDRARKLAAEVYRKESNNPAYVSTYAFSLFSDGNSAEAVRVMGKLPEAQLRAPAIAAYYGIFLATAGDRDKAIEYLNIGSAAHFLPEEKKLVDKASARLRLR